MNGWVVALAAFAVTLVLTPVAILVARRTGIMDRPGELKEQTRAVPYLGGVAVFAGMAVGVTGTRPSVLLPLVVALVLGVADDRLSLPASVRLVGELAVGALVVVTCPVHAPGWLSVLALVPLTLLLVNGANLMDGLDMLAGGTVAVAAVGFAVILGSPLSDSGRLTAIALAAALVGFLVYNRPPARIYLGDGGSYLLGTALTILVAHSWRPDAATPVGVASLILVAIPAAEVAFAVVRRLRGRRSILTGDRGHPYDRLVARGWPRLSASAAYICAQGILTICAVLAYRQGSLITAIAVDAGGGIALIIAAGLAGALSPDQEVAS
jgi:UDP-N-acetylmuramyl pentapeptide phosphotransferase/UDP-N-acetylglucosamine-1-phosphate transferase